MVNVICFFSGVFLGACVGLVVMCTMQIRRINDYESEIRKLKAEVEKNNE